MRWTRTHGPIKHISYTVCFLRGPHYTQAFSAAKSDVTALASSRVKRRERAEVRPSRRPRREKQGGRSKWLPASPLEPRHFFFFFPSVASIAGLPPYADHRSFCGISTRKRHHSEIYSEQDFNENYHCGGILFFRGVLIHNFCATYDCRPRQLVGSSKFTPT